MSVEEMKNEIEELKLKLMQSDAERTKMFNQLCVDTIQNALSKFRGDVKGLKRDASNPMFNSKYASLDSIWEAIREPLAKHGLSIVQSVERVGDTFIMEVPVRNAPPKKVLGMWIRVGTIIGYRNGTTIELPGLDIPVEANAQKIGAGITYGKRYALGAALGLAVDEDNDGNDYVNTDISIPQTPMTTPQTKQASQYDQNIIDKIKTMKPENAWAIYNEIHPLNNEVYFNGYNKVIKKLGLKFNDSKTGLEYIDIDKGETDNE